MWLSIRVFIFNIIEYNIEYTELRNSTTYDEVKLIASTQPKIKMLNLDYSGQIKQ